MKTKSSIAFFDLDKTLIDVNSAKLWVRSEFKAGRISIWMALRALFWSMMYSLGWTHMERLLLEGIAWLRGQEVVPLVKRTQKFYEEQICFRYRPGALDALKKCREAGDVIALCTSSSSILSFFVAEDLSIPHVLANGLASEEMFFTGEPDPQILCYGKGKLVHAKALAERLDISLDECSFYTDSIADVSLLEKVGRPVVVHPDRRLKRVAQKKNWPIENWGKHLVKTRPPSQKSSGNDAKTMLLKKNWPGIASHEEADALE